MYGPDSELYQRMKGLDFSNLMEESRFFDFAELSYSDMDMSSPLSKKKPWDPDHVENEIHNPSIDLSDRVAASPDKDEDMARKVEGSLSIATGTAKNILGKSQRHRNPTHTVPFGNMSLIDLKDLMNWVSQTSGLKYQVRELGPATAMVTKLGGEEQLASIALKVENEMQPVRTPPEPVTGEGLVDDQSITTEASSFIKGVTNPTSSGSGAKIRTPPELVTGDGPVDDQPITTEASAFIQGVKTHPTSSEAK